MREGGFPENCVGEVEMAPVRPRNKNAFARFHERDVMREGK
jgi:hypothetical protein